MRLRRLPVAVEPYDDEPWPNYLARLASAHHTDARTVSTSLGLRPSRYGDLSYREHGIAMAPATTAMVAQQTGLDPDRVTSMQLQKYNGTLLRMDADQIATVDPSGPPGRSNAGRFSLERMGAAHYRPSTHGCPACLAQSTPRWKLQWRLRWHVVCPDHELLIDEVGNPPVRPDHIQHILDVQRAVLHLVDEVAGPSGRQTWDFVNDLAAAIEVLLYQRQPPLRRGENVPDARQMADLLGPAFNWIADGCTAIAEDVVERLRLNQGQLANTRSLIARRQLHAGSPVREAVAHAAQSRRRRRPPFAGPWIVSRSAAQASSNDVAAYVPQLVPERLFVGALSDLLYPMDLEAGRNVAALAAVALGARSNPPHAAQALGVPPNGSRRLREATSRLRDEGRDEQFWQAVADLHEALRHESIDYGRRRRMADDARTIDLVRSLGQGSTPSVAQMWLHRWWALDYVLSTRPKLTSSRAATDALELAAGDTIRAALADVLLAEVS